MRQINSFLAELRTAYLQQGQLVRILLPASFLLLSCCLCLILIPGLGLRGSPSPVPSPMVLPTQGTQATPTALFSFDFPTFTPFPTGTSFVPTTFPTFTPSPTGSPTPTRTLPAATNTVTRTPTARPPTATATSAISVVIINVDKRAEYAEIQNLAQATVDLRGWRLVSENGNESCALDGTLAPNEVLRIWSRVGNPGFDCRLGRAMWNDNQADPAVLYNPQGEEVSRYP